METKDKLKLAYDIAQAFDVIPESGDELGSLKDFYNAYITYHIGIDEEPTFEEFEIVVKEFANADLYDLDLQLRKEYFNS